MASNFCLLFLKPSEQLLLRIFHIIIGDLGEFAQEIFLFLGELLGDLYLDADVERAIAAVSEVLYPLVLDGIDLVRLCAGFDREIRLAVQCRYLGSSAQRCLHKADGHLDVQVIALPDKGIVLFEVDEDIQIAWRPSEVACLSFTGDPHGGPGVDTCRDLDLEVLPPAYMARALAGLAGL